MGKTRRFADDCLAFLTGSATEWEPNGPIFLSLHTADPGREGNQDTSEASYPGYQRVAIDADGWNPDDVWSQVSEIRWPKAAKDMQGEIRARYVGFGLKATGAGYLAISAALDEPILIDKNTIPAIEAGELRVSEK